ncbi:hypothetical protein [Streptomyces albipurpureus]|uniref:Uncharacterized protein n=1 Tax=Streptomyces albipurpureus TaxID=2897419 RepID=A0ABT0UYG2_9ACTN|nr:hypothetical protein [Streptomyces sp. CWNU-1]MCM2393612.1 hypothetical protein [Streptomyces sp. CWNU-1]
MGLNDPGDPIWNVPLAGGTVAMPSTPDGIRAQLHADPLSAFEHKLARTPGQHLAFVVLEAAIPDAVRTQDPDGAARLMNGDFTGVTDESGEQIHLPGIEGDAPVWVIPYTGQGTIEIPATIGGVRTRLDGTRRAQFDAEVGATPAHLLHYTILQWATPDEVTAETDAVVAQLRDNPPHAHDDEAVA